MTGVRQAHSPEAELRRFVVNVAGFARLRDWKVASHQQTHGGFPQLVMVRLTTEGDHRLIFARLLRPSDHLTTAQEAWIRDVATVAAECRPHVSAFAWKPDDWPAIEATLQ
jgi:hypothetical protein